MKTLDITSNVKGQSMKTRLMKTTYKGKKAPVQIWL